MRIIARLPQPIAEQLEYLTVATGGTVSQVVREAIAAYHVQVRGARKGGGGRFLALAGTGESGHTDTASNHKALHGQYLDEKFARSQRLPSKNKPGTRRAPKPRAAESA